MSAAAVFWTRFRIILEMIKFEHTVFALPFALISLLLAARHARLPHGVPTASMLIWVVAAMVGARSAAMAFNRLVDAKFDAANPRTAGRALPAGILSSPQVAVFTLAACALFAFAAWKLNRVCFFLSPIALAAVLGYSLTKRITSLCHLVLGFAIGIAPIGAWLAVTGQLHAVPLLLGAAVMLWIGGFDIIYALQDIEFDRSAGLYSIPRRLGKANSLRLSRVMHVAMIVILIAIGIVASLSPVYFIGLIVIAGLIGYEQSIVSPTDLSRVNVAFFTLNGWISISLFAFVLLDRMVAP